MRWLAACLPGLLASNSGACTEQGWWHTFIPRKAVGTNQAPASTGLCLFSASCSMAEASSGQAPSGRAANAPLACHASQCRHCRRCMLQATTTAAAAFLPTAGAGAATAVAAAAPLTSLLCSSKNSRERKAPGWPHTAGRSPCGSRHAQTGMVRLRGRQAGRQGAVMHACRQAGRQAGRQAWSAGIHWECGQSSEAPH